MEQDGKIKSLLSLLHPLESHDEEAETKMIAILRDGFLDHEMISERMGYDISDETFTDPKYVLYYLAIYTEMLKERAK